MRIVIDLQGAQSESLSRGIGRYSLSLTKAIVRNRGSHEILIALNGLFPETVNLIRDEFYGILPQENIRVWYTLSPVHDRDPANKWRREVAEVVREAFLLSLNPDVIHVTSLFEGYVDNAITSIGLFDKNTPVSVTLYDLIPLLNSQHYLDPNPTYKAFYQRKIKYITQSSLLLSISEYSKLEGMKNLHCDESLIVNISAAADSQFQPLHLSELRIQKLREKFGISKSIILCAGGADERKNIPNLIRAYAQLSYDLIKSHQLVFVGCIPEVIITQLRNIGYTNSLQTDDLIFTGYITDEELIWLYNICELYVFPAWHEGFGLPALEAMACGAPVIAANTTSLPEVIGNKEALFDPYSEKSIADKISKVLKNKELRSSLTIKGLKQAKCFSWDASAKSAISKLETLCEKNNINSSTAYIIEDLIKQTCKFLPSNISSIELKALSYFIGKNHPSIASKQLLVDISELVQQDANTGIQRVVKSILKKLLTTQNKDIKVIPVYATMHHSYYYAHQFTSNFLGLQDCNVNDSPIEYQAGDTFLGLDFQSHIVLKNQDFYQQLRQDGVKVNFIVYDLLCVKMPGFFTKGADILHQNWLNIVCNNDGAICISKSVSKELQSWIEDNKIECSRRFNISWFHLGADIENSIPSKGFPSDANTVINIIKQRISFLMVGTIEPRKGHNQTLDAFTQLWTSNTNVNLVIVGKNGWMVEELIQKIQNHPELGKRLIYLHEASDEYLEKIYATSTCLIAASEGEGFGLPIIEAAKHKLPIIARDIPVFREIAENNAFFFSGKDASSLSESLRAWLTLYKNNSIPNSADMKFINWEESTHQLISCLSKLGSL